MKLLAGAAVVALIALVALRAGSGAPDCPGKVAIRFGAGDSRVCATGPVLGCFDEGTGSDVCHDGEPRADPRRPLRVVGGEEVAVRLREDATSLAAFVGERPLRVEGDGGRDWSVTLPDPLPGGALELGVSAQLERPAGAVHAVRVMLEAR